MHFRAFSFAGLILLAFVSAIRAQVDGGAIESSSEFVVLPRSVLFTGADRITPLRTEIKPSYTVKRASTPPVIDGKLNDWDGIPAITLDQPDQVRGGTWNGPADSSGTLRIVWDVRGLYFALNAKDNHVNLPGAGLEDCSTV